MKDAFDILIKKLYIYPVIIIILNLIGRFHLLGGIELPELSEWLYRLLDTFLFIAIYGFIFSYWIALPFAFKSKVTIHSLGHLLAFEFGFYLTVDYSAFDEMAGIGLVLFFFFFIVYVLIGMGILAMTNSLKQTLAEGKEIKEQTE